MTGSVTLNGARTPVGTTVSLPVPAPMDGTWRLRFSLATGAQGIASSARLTVANGDSLLYGVRGQG